MLELRLTDSFNKLRNKKKHLINLLMIIIDYFMQTRPYLEIQAEIYNYFPLCMCI